MQCSSSALSITRQSDRQMWQLIPQKPCFLNYLWSVSSSCKATLPKGGLLRKCQQSTELVKPLGQDVMAFSSCLFAAFAKEVTVWWKSARPFCLPESSWKGTYSLHLLLKHLRKSITNCQGGGTQLNLPKPIGS